MRYVFLETLVIKGSPTRSHHVPLVLSLRTVYSVFQVRNCKILHFQSWLSSLPVNTDSRDSDSDVDSEFESPEMGTHHGLDMDDLVDEDFQHLIAEFSVSVLSHCFTSLILLLFS